jgi:hypothetical protein
MAGSSHKPIGLIIGLSIAFVAILVIGGLLLFWCKGRHKGYKREVFVDVAGLSFLLISTVLVLCIMFLFSEIFMHMSICL